WREGSACAESVGWKIAALACCGTRVWHETEKCCRSKGPLHEGRGRAASRARSDDRSRSPRRHSREKCAKTSRRAGRNKEAGVFRNRKRAICYLREEQFSGCNLCDRDVRRHWAPIA